MCRGLGSAALPWVFQGSVEDNNSQLFWLRISYSLCWFLWLDVYKAAKYMIDHCCSVYAKYCWSLLIICHCALYTVLFQTLQLFIFINNCILHCIFYSHSHLTNSTTPSWYVSEEQIFIVQEVGVELLKYVIAYKPYGGVHKEIK